MTGNLGVPYNCTSSLNSLFSYYSIGICLRLNTCGHFSKEPLQYDLKHRNKFALSTSVSGPYSLDSDPDLSRLFGESGFWSRSRFSMTKIWTKFQLKAFQATNEAFCLLKQVSSTSNTKTYFFTSFFFLFCLHWSCFQPVLKIFIGTVFEENYMRDLFKRAKKVKITDLSASRRQQQNLKPFMSSLVVRSRYPVV